MADAPKARADVGGVARSGRRRVGRLPLSPGRWGWFFFLSDSLAVALGPAIAGIVAAAFAPRAGLAAFGAMAAPATASGGLAMAPILGMGAPLIFWLSGHYGRRRASGDMLEEVALTMATLASLHLVVTELLFPGQSPLSLALGWVFATAAVATGRQAIRSKLAGSDAWAEPAVIVGDRDYAWRLADTVSGDPGLALRVTEILDADVFAANGFRARNRNLGDARGGRRTVLVCPPAGDLVQTERLLLRLVDAEQCRVALVLPGAGIGRSLGRDRHMLRDGSTLIWVSNPLSEPLWNGAKRAFDICGSAFLLVALAPLFAILSLPALLTGQPVIFGHRRVGRDGRAFTCYKFRTMVVGAEALLRHLLATDATARREWKLSYKLRNDPRVTPIGSFLRRTSLDELPQLWNVLRGDMSLVGPRPIVEEEIERYGEDAAAYFSVKPGITGLWQVSGRCDTSYRARVAYDRWYVRNWTFAQDLGILVRTVWIVLTRTGAY